MAKLTLNIVTPEKIVYEDVVDSVSVMTEMGEVTVLPNHVPLVANLRAGELRLKKDGEEHYLVASTGFLQVRPGNQVVILADSAERADELELAQIEEARERARKMLEEKRHGDDVAFADAAAMMERELARYRVASKRKKYRDVGGSKPGA
ncbi:ATP synthase F1 subunit epsilon [Candidatus Uhrbacteria bacterium CG_4_9_14_3_um_filter_50_9]|uniref:ATP synthase epsilon chain n=1 Tax=Candidatus Uhrbacteria bacterium CG_4_9_14_3_um_filter_50_9 TaxID=1975035 RepID=A0A2M7XDB9_9BACT|nr:MAG: ATP synthase F1 subunit epsilon [Candidatus Uhrbacteria bacterium CG_4_9_14_3_um_filter_50_9]